MFKSALIPHMVVKAKKNRYSLTGWLLQHPSSLEQFFLVKRRFSVHLSTLLKKHFQIDPSALK